ncbi:MAG: CheR family methyltransferase [Pseudomonadota bacterium]
MAEGVEVDAPAAQVDPEEAGAPPTDPFRIVAVGASAGGLEPIEQFFDEIPEGGGIAYVVVQHLSPDFRSMMAELLQRHSTLKIVKIEDGMAIRPEVIYLNPPRAALSIEAGVFRLTTPASPTELTLPINDFFAALAKFAGPRAIGVVMSGTGTDGTLGAAQIAAAGGLVLAQDPITAKFESMPRSVIESGACAAYDRPDRLASLVLKAAKGEDVRDLRQQPDGRRLMEAPEREIIRLLQMRYGIDFGYYKTSTVMRRIERRATMSPHKSLEAYASSLTHDFDELEDLYADLLIGVTAFFRDKDAFDRLAERVAPALVEKMQRLEEVRVWVPGCASGEEAYTIAIMLAEAAREADVELRVKIFATDLHARSLKFAAQGFYSAETLSALSEPLLDRYFVREDKGFSIRKEIREHIVFSRHNVIKDPPFTKMDLVSCRNLLIYLDDEAQYKCIAMFHFALLKGGALLLGPSETLGGLESEFDVVNSRWRIFRKSRDIRLIESTRLLPMSSSVLRLENRPRENGRDQPLRTDRAAPRRQVSMRMYDAVLAETMGTAILVNRTGEVLHIFSDAAKYLELSAGGFSNQIDSLAREPFRLTFSAGLDALRHRDKTSFKNVVGFKADEEADEMFVRVHMRELANVETSDPPILITMTPEAPLEAHAALIERAGDAPGAAASGAPLDDRFLHRRITELERDLRYSEESLQTTVEELETSNEELQATNEELQATNEELMAANEELQTVNEELHAVNEELYTVSTEHQEKIAELTTLSSDLNNLLRNTDIGVVFLDAEQHIRRVTPAVARTFNILERDIGRPVSHVTTRFDFPDMSAVISRVAKDQTIAERNIEVDGRAYLLRVLPYTRGDIVDGTVLTFVDITDMARANRSLSQFADVVSHDLKAPLRAIRTAAEWVVEDIGANETDEVRGHVKILVEQTDRLSRMLTTLRDFSGVGSLNLPKELTHVDDIVDDIAGLYSDDQMTLVNNTAGEALMTGRAALRLVFQNLIENAVRHSDRNPVTVTVSASNESGIWRFSVEDDGPGLDPRHHEKIFLPFRRLKPPSGEAAGSGIGLALVRKTVEERGGSIEVVSDPAAGRGSRFSFTWPE